jgi:hypothetical protein
MEMELRGLLANLEENKPEAEEWLKKATELEQSISYSFGPPATIKPSNELYGQWLLNNNRPEDAMVQFDYSLKRAPKRVKSLQGKLETARRLSMEEVVNEIQKELNTILKSADSQNAIASTR